MSTYNLKAKNKETNNIWEFTAHDNYFGSHKYGYQKIMEDNATIVNLGDVLTENEFNTLYEVIEDTPVIKENLKTDTQEGWRDRLKNSEETGLHHVDGVEYNVDEDILMTFMESIQTQAYKQGQADAYRESVDIIQKGIFTDNLENTTVVKINNLLRTLIKAIEQLSSNKDK